MKTNELLTALQSLNEQRYIIAPIEHVLQIATAANAIGLIACGGAIDTETQTQVIYCDDPCY